MKREKGIHKIRPDVLAASSIAILGICAFSLAARLTLGSQDGPGPEGSLAEAFLGEARVLLGNRLYKQADIYFHRGLDYTIPENRLSDGWIARFQRELKPDEHVHAEGEKQFREIMPWLELSMRVNPGHLESALVAAYWLGRHLERPDLAEQVLLRAQRQTPFAYAVQLEKAKLYLHENRRQPALAALNAALAFWQRTGNPDDDADRLAKDEVLLLRALLLEAGNRPQDAAADYRALLAIFPERTALNQRLQALAQGHIPTPPADALLAHMTGHDDHTFHCGDEHDDHN